jgi:hypothetical protein
MYLVRPEPGATARVYVQVHNRSHVASVNVDVRVFFTPGVCVGFPELPAGFWAAFPANAPAAAAAWQPIAPAARIPRIEPGRARVVAFEWAVPADLPDGAVLLAAATPAGTAFAPPGTIAGEALTATGALGLKNEVPLRPPPTRAGNRPGALLATLHASAGARTYGIEVDAASVPMVLGAVLSTALANLAGRDDVPLLDEADFPALGELLARHPALGGQLDRSRLFVPPARGEWLRGLALAAGDAEPLVLLTVRPQPPRGRWCLVQRDENGVVRGGLTLRG